MHRFRFVVAALVAGALFQSLAGQADAQQPVVKRRLAEGVVTVIPPDPLDGETFQGPLPIVELTTGRANLDWPAEGPNFTPKTQTLKEMASRAILRHRIWNLEFAFKPMRLVEVDVPQPTGKMQRKAVWYLVYKVTYRGNELSPTGRLPDSRESIDEDLEAWKYELYSEIQPVNSPYKRFFPHFVLANRPYDKQYLDRVIPAAKMPILMREFPSKTPGVPEIPPEHFYNSVEISKVPIKLSDAQTDNGVWGFVTWMDVDPRIDYFSLYVRGLTNAFRFVDPAGAYQAGDPPATGRQFQYKTLQMNFYRPGDTAFEHEKEFRFGVPVVSSPGDQAAILDKYGIRQRVDYLWVYR
ncbi:MAG: hypothetical protein KDA47_01740 [Planctomycetales bacterium]|nr:hypothetical protein [Planctomycetales bacterium]